jgi:glycosyltransferase involved in cell wall biosynthesis
MLHDLIPLVVAAPAFAPDARRWRRIGERLTRAAGIVTNSRATAADAVKQLGVDPDRVHVAHLGVGPSFRPAATPVRADPPTLLYVGEYGPHKGFAEAFAVLDGLADAGLPHHLEMVGLVAPWHEAEVAALRAASSHPDRIHLAGYVDDVVEAYRRADALIVTSRYEGFCLPAVEAMACGTPVVAFSNSALPEVVGDAGILVPDGDVRGMVAELRALLTDDRARDERTQRGIERAGRFTWDRCAAIHAEVLRGAAGLR